MHVIITENVRNIARFWIVVRILRNGHLGENNVKKMTEEGGFSIRQGMKISLMCHKTVFIESMAWGLVSLPFFQLFLF